MPPKPMSIIAQVEGSGTAFKEKVKSSYTTPPKSVLVITIRVTFEKPVKLTASLVKALPSRTRTSTVPSSVAPEKIETSPMSLPRLVVLFAAKVKLIADAFPANKTSRRAEQSAEDEAEVDGQRAVELKLVKTLKPPDVVKVALAMVSGFGLLPKGEVSKSTVWAAAGAEMRAKAKSRFRLKKTIFNSPVVRAITSRRKMPLIFARNSYESPPDSWLVADKGQHCA